ncbi:hypothetical protein HNY73_019205 [Argiope bruennichi]|uniref:Uncharacterized protein n=1 Tax=Argiope bruennichi TaxID=94029 RepID=A0A8T0EIX3_ARGBR|nr:hypothetical protein HNY73_019205 [Argiope bruennichi]
MFLQSGSPSEDNGIKFDKDCFPLCSSPAIHLLIGADIAGKLMTGKILNFTCCLIAIETLLGWTLLEKSPSSSYSSNAMMVIDLLVNGSTTSDLWKLEAIRISDPTESKKKTANHLDIMGYFRSTLMLNEEGRYEVTLPWVLESSWQMEDTLSCNINCPREEQLILTKRLLLSLAHSIFNPLSISSSVTIIPKLMLQESWNLCLKWNDILPEDLCKRFLNWLKKKQFLSEIKIPWWMKLVQSVEETVSPHVFCDASAKAYATSIFFRVEVGVLRETEAGLREQELTPRLKEKELGEVE